MIVILIIAYIAIGLGIHEVFRRYSKISWFLFLILPLLLTPLWIYNQEKTDWFFWVKMYSILAGSCLILFLRFTHINKYKWGFHLAYLITIVNILEAISKSITTSTKIPNILIALSGFLLIATLPRTRSISVDHKKFHDFFWDIPYSWIFAYTFWDWILIYLVYPKDAAAHVAVLLAPLIAALFNRRLYIQARACTLSFYLMGAISFPKLLGAVEIPNHTNTLIALITSIIATIWISFDAIRKFLSQSNRNLN